MRIVLIALLLLTISPTSVRSQVTTPWLGGGAEKEELATLERSDHNQQGLWWKCTYYYAPTNSRFSTQIRMRCPSVVGYYPQSKQMVIHSDDWLRQRQSQQPSSVQYPQQVPTSTSSRGTPASTSTGDCNPRVQVCGEGCNPRVQKCN